MFDLIKNLLLLLVLLLALNGLSSCTTVVRNRRPVKAVKAAYIPLSVKTLDCINKFLDRDIDVLKANEVCKDVFKTK